MDNTKLRQTPATQPTVGDLVSYGDICQTSYGTGGRVIKVCPTKVRGYLAHTIIYVTEEAWESKNKFRVSDYHWLNELVAVNGRILQLYVSNEDEVFIQKTDDSVKQLELFCGRGE